MKKIIMSLGLLVGAGSLHAFKYVIHNKSGNEVRLALAWENGCVPARSNMELTVAGNWNVEYIKSGGSIVINSGMCRLDSFILGTVSIPAQANGDGEWEVIKAGIEKIK
jgi:hypothetical protein